MAGDTSLTGDHESHHLARIYRSMDKDRLTGPCHCPHLDAALYQ